MTNSGRDALRAETDELGIATITIDRAEVMNAFDIATMEALAALVDEVGSDPVTTTIVITGAGPAFTTGADLQNHADSKATGDEATAIARRSMDAAGLLVRTIVRVPVPVIAAVNGPAAGVGVSIALASDFAVLSEDAYLFFAFSGLGLMPDGGATVLLAASIGRARANDVLFGAKMVSARDAAELGMIAETLPADEFAEGVAKRARRLARGPRNALRMTKVGVNAPLLAQLDAALELESDGQTELLTGPEFAEGVSALLGKRRPDFVSLR
ncbi:enoyl-CoA hydratase-related protein [Dietzia sp.]|uniref:enoyl-CoA hydratase-related protein n=1 Tax=Dietzia sp. TaxID=1871616 RepID=UPI002FD9F17D